MPDDGVLYLVVVLLWVVGIGGLSWTGCRVWRAIRSARVKPLLPEDPELWSQRR